MDCLRAYDVKHRPNRRSGLRPLNLRCLVPFGLALVSAIPVTPAVARQASPDTGPPADAASRDTLPRDTLPPDPSSPNTSSPDTSQGWTLDLLLRDIVSQNPRIRAQAAAAAGAHYDVSAARWQYFPSPALQAESSGNDRQLVASVTQPLLSFGRLSADLSAAKAKESLANSRVDEARYLLAFRVIDLFGQYASARRAADVFEQDISRLSGLADMINRRVSAGASAPVDLNLVVTRIRQSENTLVGLQARRTNALNALSELLEKPLAEGQIILPTGAALDPFLTADLSDQAVARSLAYNPVLRRTQGEVAVAQTEQRRSTSAVKPTLFGRVERRFDFGRYQNSSFPQTRALVGIQYSLGSGLASFDRIKSAEAQVNSARWAQEAAVADARNAIANDVQSLSAARAVVVSLRANLAVQEDTVASYNRLFLAGKRSWLDMLNMVRELTGSQRDLADAEVQMVLTAYRIQLQTGQISWDR